MSSHNASEPNINFYEPDPDNWVDEYGDDPAKWDFFDHEDEPDNTSGNFTEIKVTYPNGRKHSGREQNDGRKSNTHSRRNANLDVSVPRKKDGSNGHFRDHDFAVDEHGKVTSTNKRKRRTGFDATKSTSSLPNSNDTHANIPDNSGRPQKRGGNGGKASKNKRQPGVWRPKRNSTRGARSQRSLQNALGDLTAELMGERDFRRDSDREDRKLESSKKVLADKEAKDKQKEEDAKRAAEREALIKSYISGMIGKTYKMADDRYPIKLVLLAGLLWSVVGQALVSLSNEPWFWGLYLIMSAMVYYNFFGFRVPGDAGTVTVLGLCDQWSNHDMRTEFARRGDMVLPDARFVIVEIRPTIDRGLSGKRVVSIELLAQMLGPNVTLETKEEDVFFKMASVAKTNTALNLNKYDFTMDDDVARDTLEMAKVIYRLRMRRNRIWHF